MKSIVILISWQFNHYSYTRLGLDVLDEKNKNYKVINLFEIIYSDNKDTFFHKSEFDNLVMIQSVKELQEILKEAKYIFNFLNFKKDTLFIYRLLTKLNKQYISFDNMPLPSNNKISLYAPKNMFKHFLKRILNLYFRETLLPASASLLVKPKNKFPHSTHQIIYAHSIDYDTYLRFESQENTRLITTKYVVFLDQNLPFHLDFVRNRETPYVTEKKYYESLNKYFDYVEKFSGNEVVIAAHPNSDKNKNYFKHRKVIWDKTIDLVKYADNVILHSSTAVSYAVIYNKPITMIVTDEITSSKMQLFNQLLSVKLNTTLVNIDIENALNFDIDVNAYEFYKKNYISNSSFKNKLSMEILIDYLELVEEQNFDE